QIGSLEHIPHKILSERLGQMFAECSRLSLGKKAHQLVLHGRRDGDKTELFLPEMPVSITVHRSLDQLNISCVLLSRLLGYDARHLLVQTYCSMHCPLGRAPLLRLSIGFRFSLASFMSEVSNDTMVRWRLEFHDRISLRRPS